MKKCLWIGLLFSSLYGWYGDIGLQLTPVYVILNDSENTTYGYGIYGIEGRGQLFLSRGHGLDVIVRDTLLAGTNLSNSWEIRRLCWKSEGEREGLVWAVLAGRERFSLDEGRLLERSADGLGGQLFWNGVRLEGALGYAGFTEWVESNRPASTQTNHRVYTGVSVSFPLWVLSFVRIGGAGSVDMRTNFRTSLVDIASGVQGSVFSWLGYSVHLWYETGEITLTNLSVPEKVSAWATEMKMLIGSKKMPLQGMVRYLAAAGENASSEGWNRFAGVGKIEGPAVFVHPVANLWMVQGRITWRDRNERILISGVYGLLSRLENKDLTMVSLYGSENLLGHEFALQMVLKIDPSLTFFATGGWMIKGDAFAINKDKPLYQISVGMNISL